MTAYFGARRRYSGERQKDWPGVAGVAPLTISSDRCFVHFHSDASVGLRGFKLTAKAPVSEEKTTELLESLRGLMHSRDNAAATASAGSDYNEDEVGVDISEEDNRISRFACGLALQATNNQADRALAFLHSNHEGLHDEAHREMAKLEQAGAQGIFRNRHTGLQVSLQTGELVVGGKAMLPMPAHVAGHRDFRDAMGYRVPLCSVIAHDDDGEWFRVAGTQRLDGAEVELFAHRVKLAELPETYRAKHERAQLEKAMAPEALAAAGCVTSPAALRLHTAILQLLKEEEVMHSLRENAQAGVLPEAFQVDEFAQRCLAALADLGGASLEGVGFLNEADGSQLVAKLPELKLPIVRRQFFARLQQIAQQQIALQERETASEHHAHDQKVDGPWLIGGYDERPDPPSAMPGGQPFPTLKQEEGGLIWCGCSYKPYHPLHAQPSDTVPSWQKRFETKLFATVHSGEFFEVRDRLLCWVPSDRNQSPTLLMYCPPIGEPTRTNDHPGMLYEIGPLHGHSCGRDAAASDHCVVGLKWISVGSSKPMTGTEIVSEKLAAELQQQKFKFTLGELDDLGVRDLRSPCFIKTDVPGEGAMYFEPEDYTHLELQDAERYGVWALLPTGLHAYERRLVYSNDFYGAMYNFTDPDILFSALDFGRDARAPCWLPGCRGEGGALFNGLLDGEGNLTDSLRGLGGLSHLKTDRIRIKRIRAPMQRAADVAALEEAQLGDVDGQEWDYQLSISVSLLNTLIPAPIHNVFEFWQTSATTIWAYRKQVWVEARANEEKEAKRKSKTVYRTEWWDGYALHITLLGESQLALIRRLNWLSPLAQKEGEVEQKRSGPCLTLLHASLCAPGSTVRRLLKLLRRLVTESNIFFWTESAELRPGDECTIHSIEIPTMELTFVPEEVWLPGCAVPVTRYVCGDLKSMWLADDPNQSQLQRHLDGLPIGVWLQSADYEYALLLPNTKLQRYTRYRCPTLDQVDVEPMGVLWYSKEQREYGRRYFLYLLHVSGSYLRTTTIEEALFLAYCRVMTRRFALVPPLIEAAFKDTPYERKREAHLVRWILEVKMQNPDYRAVVLPLMLTCLESSDINVDKNTVKDYFERYMTELDYISPECLLLPGTEKRLCEWCGERGRAKIISKQQERECCSSNATPWHAIRTDLLWIRCLARSCPI